MALEAQQFREKSSSQSNWHRHGTGIGRKQTCNVLKVPSNKMEGDDIIALLETGPSCHLPAGRSYCVPNERIAAEPGRSPQGQVCNMGTCIPIEIESCSSFFLSIPVYFFFLGFFSENSIFGASSRNSLSWIYYSRPSLDLIILKMRQRNFGIGSVGIHVTGEYLLWKSS